MTGRRSTGQASDSVSQLCDAVGDYGTSLKLSCCPKTPEFTGAELFERLDPQGRAILTSLTGNGLGAVNMRSNRRACPHPIRRALGQVMAQFEAELSSPRISAFVTKSLLHSFRPHLSMD